MSKKRNLVMILSTLITFSLTIDVFSAEQTYYKRYGRAYQMETYLVQEQEKELYTEYSNIILEYGKPIPTIYFFNIEKISTMIKGFTKITGEGTAIYLNANLPKDKMTQIYIHEAMHYVYKDISPLYEKDEDGRYCYPILIEQLNELVASAEYKSKYNNEYNFCYYVDEAILQNSDFLIDVYKGKYPITEKSKKILADMENGIEIEKKISELKNVLA